MAIECSFVFLMYMEQPSVFFEVVKFEIIQIITYFIILI